MNTTLENNRLIAEFMGIDLISSNVLRKAMLNDLTYHSDWNELNKVIKRIERDLEEEFRVIVFEEECYIWQKTSNGVLLENFIEVAAANCEFEKINSAHNAVVEFITWYKTWKS